MFLQISCLLYLIIISYFDLTCGRIPNPVTIVFSLAVLAFDLSTVPADIPVKLMSSLFFFLVFFVTAAVTKGIGMGDVKLAAVIGYCSGFFRTSLVLISACTIGAAVFLFFIIFRYKIKRLPFAPFVTAGYIVTNIFCRRII